jgi:hypothetical protein
MARRGWQQAEDGAERPEVHAEERVLRELRAVYRHADAAYAPFSCPASGECCQLTVTKREPWLWLPEWLLLTRSRPVPPPRADGACPFLDAAGRRCTAYADRPFGCRTYFCGRMRGPPHQPLEAVVTLSQRIESLSVRLEPLLAGPRPILTWCAEARRRPEEP